jgi:low affinity Fe/Cu permease
MKQGKADLKRRPGFMERISGRLTGWTGSTPALALAVALIVGWLVTGPLFHFSDTWQLVINTTTTVVTFLMVFMIQRTQNKESQALNLKLNELIAAMEGSSNRLIDVESLSEHELATLAQHYRALVKMAARDDSLLESHTVEEAQARHERKSKSSKSPRARAR